METGKNRSRPCSRTTPPLLHAARIVHADGLERMRRLETVRVLYVVHLSTFASVRVLVYFSLDRLGLVRPGWMENSSKVKYGVDIL